jgi:tetratricopeptide (TPR) repeat protein
VSAGRRGRRRRAHVPRPAATSSAASRHTWLPALPFFAGAVVFAWTLRFGFVWDDVIWLEQQLRFYRSVGDAFFTPASVPRFPGVYRPMTMASYYLDQALWWRQPFGFHLSSVILHATNGTLVYGLARALRLARPAALVGALVFAVHPVHTESVAWVTARVDVLATTFVLVGMLAFLRYREDRRGGWLGLILLSSWAAVASKEVGGTLPILLATAWLIPPASPPGAETTRVWPWPAILAAVAGLLLYLAMRPADQAAERQLLAFDGSVLGDLVRAFGFYAAQMLVPLTSNPYRPAVPGGAGPWLAAVAALAFGLILAVRPAPERAHRRFALLWIVVSLGPSLLVAAAELSATAIAERYLYLPSVGLALLLAAELETRPRITATRAGHLVLATLLLMLATTTIARARVWQDELTLWSDVVRQGTDRTLPYMNLGVALFERGDLAGARAALTHALARDGSPENRRNALVNLGLVDLRAGADADAAASFRDANALGEHAMADYGLAVIARRAADAHAAAGDAAAAARERALATTALQSALDINPRMQQAHVLLGGLAYDRRDYPAAIAHYRAAVALGPDTQEGRRAQGAIEELSR